MVARTVVWAARAAWLAVAVVGGPAIGEALSEHSRDVQLAGTAAAWAGWAFGAVALALPGVATLTIARSVVPASALIALIALVDRRDSATALALLVPGIIATALVASAEFGRHYLQASAYGAEARFGLRPPIGYLIATVVSWFVSVTALVLALPAIAAKAWVLASVCVLVAGAGALVLPRRWHQLSRRWFVLVPAGVVIHDPVVLAETLMMPRNTIASIAINDLGPTGDRAADLTGPAPGLNVEIRLNEGTSATLAPTPDRPEGIKLHLTALVVAPTRPGAAVRASRRYVQL